ncbi:MAG: pyridoxamine 5'-phosphate oxidase family protein [Rhizobiaceae bacterium]|nr:pyridoxamine 5'-phosphate oxidase family protein [Rhizobiaceae bacterium]
MSDKHNDVDKLYEVIDDIEIAMMTTVEKDGSLHTRPMANQHADADGAIWFFTEKTGAVARNLKANPKVSLGYASSGAYAALTGTGRVVDDRRKIDELWSASVEAWFPEGKDDPDLTLVRVDPDLGEFWTFPSKPISQAIGYVKAKLTGQRADDIGDNRKVAL